MNDAATATPKVKSITDKNGKLITAGTVVRHGDGWSRVRSVQMGAKSVNLGPVFGGAITHFKVSIVDIFEDEDQWMDAWRKSEAYQSM